MAKAASSKSTRRKTNRRKEIAFDYIKSNFFRVIHVDGAFGGLAPSGNIHMALYSERQAIPTRTVFPFEGDKLGPENLKKREVRESLVREVEVDVVLSIDQARALHKWLTGKIESLEGIIGLQVADQLVDTTLLTLAKPKTRKLGAGVKRKASKS